MRVRRTPGRLRVTHCSLAGRRRLNGKSVEHLEGGLTAPASPIFYTTINGECWPCKCLDTRGKEVP
ncbi:hypothetical protein C0J52_18807 [Blattella germanica]|nr:hypothetical protein C0J52_18807 [Blattella germanica]